MKEKKNNRNKWLHLRLTEEEYTQLNKAFASTTERKLSDYSRKILLGRPMIGGYRNLTTDALVTEFAQLIKTLNGIGNNFNQVVHKLHTLRHDKEFSALFTAYEMDKRKLLKEVQDMRDFMNKCAGQWLQS
ncbi:plasmid mobilization relaxosome protein MobC [Pedobacter sp. ASV28]|uniref:plasmid mobilization protein n=1 Tax=Pedobacter sp. ASV28 TaxID=2795123 RepID=UPI001E62D537|nr:plasmid mobilization relaxosome protein MobC [Pedobacter sp. ASV28]